MSNLNSNEITVAYIKENQLVFSEIDKYLEPLLYQELPIDERKARKLELEDYIRKSIREYVIWKTLPVTNLMEDAGLFLATGKDNPTDEEIRESVTEENIKKLNRERKIFIYF